jgi:16S rRNA G966 N2-methylase RsmD
MPDPREDLRSTEESISRDAEQVVTLEEEKAALDPADPRVDRLSEQVERVAARLHHKAAAERELSEEIQAPE